MTALRRDRRTCVLAAVVAARQLRRRERAAVARRLARPGDVADRVARPAEIGVRPGVAELDPVAVRVEVLDRVQGTAEVGTCGLGVLRPDVGDRPVEQVDDPALPAGEVLAVEVERGVRLVAVDRGVRVDDLVHRLLHRARRRRDREELLVERRHRTPRDALVRLTSETAQVRRRESARGAREQHGERQTRGERERVSHVLEKRHVHLLRSHPHRTAAELGERSEAIGGGARARVDMPPSGRGRLALSSARRLALSASGSRRRAGSRPSRRRAGRARPSGRPARRSRSRRL